jgi:hypothetical protein
MTRPFSFERRWGLGNGSALLVSGLVDALHMLERRQLTRGRRVEIVAELVAS